jgi:Tol biopolymer transport system component
VGRPTNFTFTAPEEAAQIVGAPVSSPDGRHIAYVARNQANDQALWLRSLDSAIPRRISGTDGALNPFWSPDARFVGFGVPAEGRLKRVELATGVIQNIVNIRDDLPGGTWSVEDVILFAPDSRVVLHRVSASGGVSQPVTTLDATRRENSHRYPHFLPDGRHFLFTARSDVRENTGIYVGRLGSTDRSWLVEAQSAAAYAAGHLLFVREGTLLAQRFDAATLRLSGEPFALVSNVAHNAVGANASFSVSADGRVLVHLMAADQRDELAWLDRRGARIGAVIAEGPFQQIRLAPDGRQVALVSSDRDSGNRDIWLADTASGALTRLTSHPANDWHPVWSPGGDEIAFASDRDGFSALYRKSADGSGSEVPIPTGAIAGHRFPNDWSAAGGLLALHSSTPETALDVWVVPTDSRPPYDVARSTFQEHSTRFSPDGRWMAYVSDESGAPEVYVQPVGKAGKRRVSTSGGIGPRWSGDGRELFFIDASNRLVVAAIGTGEPFESSPPVVLHNSCRPRVFEEQRYEVAPDGTRSLWVCPPARVAPSVVNVSIEGLLQTDGN